MRALEDAGAPRMRRVHVLYIWLLNASEGISKMRKQVLSIGTLAAIALMAATAVTAQQIYRWVDTDGVVHFGNLPPEGVEAQAISVRANTVQSVPARKAMEPGAGEAPADGDPAAAGDGGAAPAADLSFAAQRRKDRADRRVEQAEEARELAARCAAMREQKAWVEPSPRVLVQDDDGTTRRLDDSEREKLLKEANDFLAANCN